MSYREKTAVPVGAREAASGVKPDLMAESAPASLQGQDEPPGERPIRAMTCRQDLPQAGWRLLEGREQRHLPEQETPSGRWVVSQPAASTRLEGDGRYL